jgi:TonB-linked SusC/RagA family outer membrane protein
MLMILVMLAGIAFSPNADAQEPMLRFASADRRPRFLMATARETVTLDIARTPALRRRVTLEMRDTPLRDVLAEIAAQAGLSLSFSPDVVNLDTRVSVDATNLTVAAALTDLLLDLGVDVVLSPTGQLSVVRQPPPPAVGTISGTVTEAIGGKPIPQAQVSVAGTAFSRSTDEEGRYLISGVPSGLHRVTVRRLGYDPATQEVTVPEEASVTLDFQLTAAAMRLNEIVTSGTAAGTQTRAMGNVVAKVDVARAVEELVPQNVQTILSSKVAGIYVPSGPGNVGTGSAVRIRGSSSLTLGSAPLVYVDGVRIDATQGVGPRGGMRGGTVSRLNDLQLEEIENIEVIKGPAAATLFGTEASAGVIVITTKRGDAGKTRWDMTVKQGGTKLMDPIDRWPEVFEREASGAIRRLNVLRNDIANGYGLPWQTGHNQGYGIAADGGTPAARYFGSADFNRDEGYVPWNWQNKTNMRLNLSLMPSQKVMINSAMGYIKSTTRFDAAGPFPAELGSSIYWGYPRAADTRSHGWNWTPPEAMATVEGMESVNRFIGSVSVSNSPLSWLTHRLTAGTDVGESSPSRMFPRSPLGTADYFSALSLGHIEVSTMSVKNSNIDYGASATVPFLRNFSSETSVGAQFLQKSVHEYGAVGDGFPAPGKGTVSSAAVKTGFEDFLENKSFGAYIQQQLAWHQRRFVTVGVRGDDNSAFGANFKFVAYPKISASWVINEEPFWNIPRVSALKLRAAWGRAGRQPDAFAARRLYAPFTAGNDQPGLRPDAVGNPDLKPEVGEELELGFDSGFLDERIEFSFTHYKKNTKDAIVQAPVAPSSGFSGSQFVNVGEITNSGIELELGTRILQRQSFGAEMDFVFSTNKSNVVSLGGLPPIQGFVQRTEEGKPIGAIFQPRVVSAEFGPTGSIINALCEATPAQGGGTVPCAQAQSVYMGPALPTWQGSWSGRISFLTNFQFFAQVAFQGGYKKVSGDLGASHLLFKNSEAIVARNDPILATMDEIVPGGVWTQAGVMDAGFAKLRDISLMYTMPQRIVSRLGGASRGSLSVGARNLATLWQAQEGTFGRQEIDIELNDQWRPGNELGAYNQTSMPMSTTFLATLRLTY